ncbi:MAG: ErfK/YbiS/YcfS/YnhG family protein [Candidatus Giovannonibacteria bacterium GW2011_GWA2_44_13b]|nr:MAG: ErfK/YbiS/YcfS/YnhG family protein [Candidatus Giovannonibacteria bacterium GW2011_GWA2_44_13b]
MDAPHNPHSPHVSHVPIEHHRKVVRRFSVAILFISGLLLTVLALNAELFYPQEKKEPQARYLQSEEGVFISAPGSKEPIVLPVKKVLFEYIEVAEGCGPDFSGACLNVRSGPGEDFSVVTRLRRGVVLKVGGKVERDGHAWYKIVFNEWLRYPERVTGDWYVAADYVNVLLDEGNHDLLGNVFSKKKIVIDRSEQMLRAYDGDELFMETKISTGLELTPTPRGKFVIFKKTPSRYMQGPIPGVSGHYYDLPGVPWDMYFTYQGAAIHGTYWHENFGRPASNGCVNLPVPEARKLYTWAEVGALVIVQD